MYDTVNPDYRQHNYFLTSDITRTPMGWCAIMETLHMYTIVRGRSIITYILLGNITCTLLCEKE